MCRGLYLKSACRSSGCAIGLGLGAHEAYDAGRMRRTPNIAMFRFGMGSGIGTVPPITTV